MKDLKRDILAYAKLYGWDLGMLDVMALRYPTLGRGEIMKVVNEMRVSKD